MRLWDDKEFRAALSEEERRRYDELYEQSTSAAFDRLGSTFRDLCAAIEETFPIGRWCRRLNNLLAKRK